MKTYKKLIGCFLIVFLFMALPVSANKILDQKEESVYRETSTIFDDKMKTCSGAINADLKIKTPDGEWVDDSVELNVGDTVEFSITAQVSRNYFWFGMLVELPTVNNQPMFEVDFDSVSDKPVLPFGTWRGSNKELAWSWFEVSSSWSKTVSFEATVKKSGSLNINLIVGGDYVENSQIKEDSGSDSIDVSSKGKSKHAPLINPQILPMNPFSNFRHTKIGVVLYKIWELVIKTSILGS